MAAINYYLGFVASEELSKTVKQVLVNFENKEVTSQAPYMIKLSKLFVPELLDTFLLNITGSVGIQGVGVRVINSTASTITKTCDLLASRLLKKLSNEDLRPLVGFIDNTFLPAATNSYEKDTVACEISEEQFLRFREISEKLKAGEGLEIRSDVDRMMVEIVDAMLNGFMKAALNATKMNFVLKKVSNAATETCRGAAVMVVNKVFKKLNGEQLFQLGEYCHDLALTAERPLPEEVAVAAQ